MEPKPRPDASAPQTHLPVPAATAGSDNGLASDSISGPSSDPPTPAEIGEFGANDAGGEPAIAPEPADQAPWYRFWLRPLVLAVLASILLGLTYWDSRRVPTRPARPNVLIATPQAGAPHASPDPALTDTLVRLRLALSRRDSRALASLADPDGVVVAAYSGGLPDSGYSTADPQRLAQEVLQGGQIVVLGWREDGRGRVIVLTDGWVRRPLRLTPNSTLEQTHLAAIGLVSRANVWYWRWLLFDPTGTLSQQARTTTWQPWPS
jgi:hypothetical protein